MSTLNIADLSVSYAKRVILRSVNIPPLRCGELTALVGPNAAGKSTLLRAIAQLIPTSGSIRLDGNELRGMPPSFRASLLGYMPQSLPHGAALNVIECVMAALMAVRDPVDRRTTVEIERRVITILDELGIGRYAMSELDSLSGGQRQLASLAQVIARDPTVILLDEPTSALDLRHQLSVMAAVRRLAIRKIVVIVLHDLDIAARWADRIVVLDNGSLYSSGSPSETITSTMLQQVYGVIARVEHDSRGYLRVMADEVT